MAALRRSGPPGAVTVSPCRRSISRQARRARVKSLWIDGIAPSWRTRVATMCMWSMPPSDSPCRTATQRTPAGSLVLARPKRSMNSVAICCQCSSATSGSVGAAESTQCHTVPGLPCRPVSFKGVSSRPVRRRKSRWPLGLSGARARAGRHATRRLGAGPCVHRTCQARTDNTAVPSCRGPC